MPTKQLLGIDELTGVKTYHYYDPATNKTYIEHVQDVEPIIEKNKEIQKTDIQAKGARRGWMPAAHIPDIVYMKWRKEYNIDIFNPEDDKKVRRLLMDPEWRYLRLGNYKL